MISDALRQAFMPKQEYESLREEEKASRKPLIFAAVGLICLLLFVPTAISLKIVFPDDNLRRPFCHPISVNFTALVVSGRGGKELDLSPGAFSLTDQETVDYYWMVVFLPSAMLFAASVVYLVAGVIVAYTAPAPHMCLRVVQNSCCCSRRGGVGCLSLVNLIFAAAFGLLAVFLGSTLLTLSSSCSKPLFWCYEISSWSLVILHGAAAFFLQRKAGNFPSQSIGIEMLEANPIQITPELEKRVHESFKSWMGPTSLSSDEEAEEEPSDRYQRVPSTTP